MDNTPEGCAALQWNFDWLEKWTDRSIMLFNKSILAPGNSPSMLQYVQEVTQLESSSTDFKLNISQQCFLVSRGLMVSSAALGRVWPAGHRR